MTPLPAEPPNTQPPLKMTSVTAPSSARATDDAASSASASSAARTADDKLMEFPQGEVRGRSNLRQSSLWAATSICPQKHTGLGLSWMSWRLSSDRVTEPVLTRFLHAKPVFTLPEPALHRMVNHADKTLPASARR